jgi:hypothetical protein
LQLGVQALIWFGAAGGAGAFGLSLLWQRFVRQEPHAVRSGGAYTLFAVCMLLFALGALAAGFVSAGIGR